MKEWAKYIFVQASWFGKGLLHLKQFSQVNTCQRLRTNSFRTTGLGPLTSPVKMKMFLCKGSSPSLLRRSEVSDESHEHRLLITSSLMQITISASHRASLRLNQCALRSHSPACTSPRGLVLEPRPPIPQPPAQVTSLCVPSRAGKGWIWRTERAEGSLGPSQCSPNLQRMVQPSASPPSAVPTCKVGHMPRSDPFLQCFEATSTRRLSLRLERCLLLPASDLEESGRR